MLERATLMLKQIPIGTKTREYMRLSTSLGKVIIFVVRAMICVQIVMTTICHVVRVMGNGYCARIHLFWRITAELIMYHILHVQFHRLFLKMDVLTVATLRLKIYCTDGRLMRT